MEIINNEITEICNFLNNIPTINGGGCGVAAIVIHDILNKYNIPNEIIFLYDHNDDYDLIRNKTAKQDLSKEFASCDHAVIWVEGQYIDTSGFKYINKYKSRISMSREEVIKSLRQGIWYWLFNRNIWIPYIEEKIGYKLNLDVNRNSLIFEF